MSWRSFANASSNDVTAMWHRKVAGLILRHKKTLQLIILGSSGPLNLATNYSMEIVSSVTLLPLHTLNYSLQVNEQYAQLSDTPFVQWCSNCPIIFYLGVREAGTLVYRGIWGNYNIFTWNNLGQFPQFRDDRSKPGSLERSGRKNGTIYQIKS